MEVNPKVGASQMDSVRVLSAKDDKISSEEYTRQSESRSPIRLALKDVALLIINAAYIPYVLLPAILPKAIPGVTLRNKSTVKDYFLIILLVVLELPALIAVVPAFLLLPGWLFIASMLGYCLILYSVCAMTWSSRLVARSKAQLSEPQRRRFATEKWVFINGIATSYDMLQQNVDLVSGTFGREVLGIHNRSYGIIGDLLECIIQRSFNYETNDVRVAYAAVKGHLLDENVSKVVVIAHSQGGIILSMVLDRLYARLPIGLLSKLEIFTFGSAASGFNNPILNLTPEQRAMCPGHLPQSPTVTSRLPIPTNNSVEEPSRAVRVIEHFVNEKDLVPRWGVLYHVAIPPQSTQTTYSGRVFIHNKNSGHLFDQHYLEAMFPVEQLESDDPKLFFNHRTCNDDNERLLRSSTIPKGSEEVKTSDQRRPSAWLDGMPRGSADGYRVKDLSRLWSYLGGRTGDEKPER